MKKMKKMLKMMLVAVMMAGMFWGVELEANAESGMQVLENTLDNVDGMKATVEHDAAAKTIKVKIDATNYNLDVGGTYKQMVYRPSVSVYGVGGYPGWTEPAYEFVTVKGLTTEIVYKYENTDQLYGIYDLKFDTFQLYHTKNGYVETNLYSDTTFNNSYIRVMFPMTSSQSVSYSAKIDKVIQDVSQIYEYETNGSCSVTADEYNFREIRLKAKADFGAGLTPDIGYDYTYSWTLPNGNTSSAQEVDVPSNGPGIYKVQVTATRKTDISGEWLRSLGYQDFYSSETTINVIQNDSYECEVKWAESIRNAGNKIAVGDPLKIVAKLGSCGQEGATLTLYKNNETVGSWHVKSAYTNTITVVESANSTYAGEYTWTIEPKANLFSKKSGTTEILTVEKIHSQPIVSITEVIPHGNYIGTIKMSADVPGSFTISSTDGTTVLVPEKTYNFTGEEISVEYGDLVQGNPANGTYSLSYTFVPENTSDYFSTEEGTVEYSISSQSTIEIVQGVPEAAGYVSVDGKTSGSFYWDINKPVTITVTSLGIFGKNVSSKITGITVNGESLSDVTISADKLTATGSFTPTVSGKTYTVSATYDYKKLELKNRATFYLDEEITADNLDKMERELFKAIYDKQNSFLPSLNYDEIDVAVEYLAGTNIMGSGIYNSLDYVPPAYVDSLHAFGAGSPEMVNVTFTIDGTTLEETLIYVYVVKRTEPIMTVSSSSIELARGDSMSGDMKSAIGAKIGEVGNATFSYTDKEGNAITDNYLKNVKANEPFEVTVKFAGNATYKPASKAVTVVVKDRLNVNAIEKEYVYLAGSRGIETIDIAGLLPTDIKNATYTLVENSAAYIVNESLDITGKLSYEVNKLGALGNTSELIITVSSDNYVTGDIKVKIKLIDKYQVSENPDYKVAIKGSNVLIYGQPLSDLELNSDIARFVGNGQNVAGTLAWTRSTDVLDAGTTSAEWTFTPNDTEMYQTLTGTVDVAISKAENSWITEPSMEGWTYGDSANKPIAEAKAGTIKVTYTGTANDGTTWNSTDVPAKAGTYEAIFSVEESKNYGTLNGQAQFEIVKREVTIEASVNASKEYDGKSNAEIADYQVKNVVGSDVISVDATNAKAYYADKNAGANKTVAFSGFAITGSDVDNYVVSSQPENTTAEITKKRVTVSATAPDKVYNGVAADIELSDILVTFTGILEGDEVGYTVKSAQYQTNDVTTNTAVSIVYNVTGSDAGNYAFPETEKYAAPDYYVEATAAITKRELTIDVVVADKQYDGLNTAKITSAKLNNVAEGDEILLISGIATFESVDVAENISICFTEFSLDGESSVLKNYTLKQPTGVTANITNEWTPKEYFVTELNDNGWLNETFELKAKEGYLLSLTNTAGGDWSETLTYDVETAEGSVTFYLKNVETGTISLKTTESYKLDKTVPIGTVTMTDISTPLKQFINKITFGIFYNKNVEISVTAEDVLSGVDKIEYFESDKELSLDEIKEISNWTVMKNGKVSVAAENEKQFIYYIRIADKAENMTYLNTDIAEYDTVAPVISGIENGKTYYTTQKVDVSDKNLETVTLNGETVGESFVLEGNKEATYTIIATDKANNTTTYTVTMKKKKVVDESNEDSNDKEDETTSNSNFENVTVDEKPGLEAEKADLKENSIKNVEEKKIDSKESDKEKDKESSNENIKEDIKSKSDDLDATFAEKDIDEEQQVIVIDESEPTALTDTPNNKNGLEVKICLLLLGASILGIFIIFCIYKNRKKEQEEE